MQHNPFVSSFTLYRWGTQVVNIDDGDFIIIEPLSVMDKYN